MTTTTEPAPPPHPPTTWAVRPGCGGPPCATEPPTGSTHHPPRPTAWSPSDPGATR